MTERSPSHASPLVRWLATVRWDRAAITALLVFYALAAFHEIASPWLWGHNGYNGAAFSQAARNTLRFGELGQAQYWAEPAPPPAWAIYTRHPPMLHLHIAGLFTIFGQAEWVARLVPAVYSVLNAALLAWVVRQWWGRAQAVAALAVYVFLPVNLIYTNMIDHEQGSIFWTLVMLHNGVRILQATRDGAPRWRNVVMLAIATTIACQWDWPPYYIAFYFAIFATLLGIQRSKRLQWRREYTLVAWFSVVVLANFIGYFAWIHHRLGSLDDLVNSFEVRSSTPHNVWSQQLSRLPDMLQALALWLAVAWTIGFLVRLGRREARLADFLPLAFLAAQVLHTAVFKVAGYLHVYWFYHAAPWVGIAAGLALVSLARGSAQAATALVRGRWRLPARLFAATAVVVAVIAPLGVEGLERMVWGRTWAGEPYLPGEADADYEKGLMARWANEMTAPDEAVAVHPTLAFRVEVLWYLDRPNGFFEGPIHAGFKIGEYPAALFIVHLRYTPDYVLRSLFERRYDATLLDTSMLIFDLRSRNGRLSAWRLDRLEPGLAWRYFVSPRHPPVEWVEDAAYLQRLVDRRAEVLGGAR